MVKIIEKIANKFNNNNLYENYEKFKGKFKDFVDLSKTIKTLGKWMTECYLTSVDITGIFYNQFNKKRYILNWIHFVLINIGVWLLVLLISIDSLWQLIDNKFWPKNLKIALIAVAGSGFVIISFRFDALFDEWYNHLKMFKFAYYLQENIPSKHGLTERNYFKLSILLKAIESIKIYALTFVLSISLLHLYIAIKANNLLLQLLFPVLIYGISIGTATIILTFLISFLSAYYYKLMFDQINDQIETIYKRSINSLSIVYKLRLIRLVIKHDNIAKGMFQLIVLVRRSAVLYIIVLTLAQIIALNLFFDSDTLYYKTVYIGGLFISITFGFGFVFACSFQINAAHKPVRLIRKILYKHQQNFNLKFNLKVIQLNKDNFINKVYLFLDVKFF